jgi:hypothetical protein
MQDSGFSRIARLRGAHLIHHRPKLGEQQIPLASCGQFISRRLLLHPSKRRLSACKLRLELCYACLRRRTRLLRLRHAHLYGDGPYLRTPER